MRLLTFDHAVCCTYVLPETATDTGLVQLVIGAVPETAVRWLCHAATP